MELPFLLVVFLLPLVSSKFEYKTPKLKKEYDYIVVGGGTSGSVLANRLSENENVTVLLLEAGGPPPGLSEVPVFAPLLASTPEDWAYVTEPQTNAFLGYKNQETIITRYKALGGCSAHNFMIYARGNKRDYDEWAKNGAKGWSWKEVFPYFKKSEDQRDPSLLSEGYHGTGGYQTVSPSRYVSNGGKALLKGAEKTLGIKPGDYNGPSANVISPIQTTQRDGLRCSVEKAFLRPASDRNNLDILPYAFVTKINIDDNMTANSVTFDYQNSTLTVASRKEIILSAGAIGTPHLLLVSGIGPKLDLEELGIRCIKDLPVGENFQDHVTAQGQYYKVNDTSGIVFSRVSTPENVGLLQDGIGPLTSPSTLDHIAFVNSKYQNVSENWPDIEMYTLSTFFASYPQMMIPELMGEFVKQLDLNTISLFPGLLRPKSRGYVKLRTPRIHDHPVINPKYLSEKEDVDRLIDGMKMIDTWVKAEEFQQLQPELISDALPICKNLTTGSDEYYECLIRLLPGSIFHPCCTCKMGDVNDNTTVVDPELRVKGIKGLRIVDASVMPNIVSGNTNAPCMMIAEKAADMISGNSK